MRKLKFNVHGRQVLVERELDHWSAFCIGADGKRCQAEDIPTSLAEAELEPYLDDLCYERAAKATVGV